MDISRTPDPLQNIGALRLLPQELRNEVWRLLLHSKRLTFGPLHKTAIFRTCKQIHNEIIALLYNNKTLTITLSASFNRKAWFTLEVSQGLTWNCMDGNEALASIPFSRFREIKVEISAPKAKDQGQLICLFHKALELSKILSNQSYLPCLHISLVDTKKSSWCTEIIFDGTKEYHESFVPQKLLELVSSRVESLSSSRSHDYDYVAILRPFYRLHNVHEASVTVPKNLQVYLERSDLLEGFASPKSEALWSDELIQRHLDTIFVLFEDELDAIQGQTAGRMRLRRFSKWFADGDGKIQAYLSELRRIYNSQTDVIVDYERIQRRYVWMKTLNPMSSKLQMRSAQSRAYVLRQTHDAFSAASVSVTSTFEDGWSAEEWYNYYPFGIVGLDFDSYGHLHGPAVTYEATDDDKKALSSLFDEIEHEKEARDLPTEYRKLDDVGKEASYLSPSLTPSRSIPGPLNNRKHNLHGMI
ncbi:hypothetical protein ONS95_000425 [Cadophora gregata]|uniref:uncharacterized protein n=1 Tax=Cadophora gregata TaxID=51156 RepID=UPI0026DC131F|nr:uncharacterized protein ONS95_000425 [Cadophora gregata]KAK0128453.1 hypothetical protein ONS95_000425 [Cadophora gregata]